MDRQELNNHREFISPKSALSKEEIKFLREQIMQPVETIITPEDAKDKTKPKLSIKALRTIGEADWIGDHPEVGMEELKTSEFLMRKLGNILGKDKVGKIGGGVYGILNGDNLNGLTIFIRGDMDAIFTPDGKAEHMCGHNIHTAWLILNARLLKAYKEKFGSLPFKRVVFIGEPNEEGAVNPEFGPIEMINSGLINKVGKPDLILGAHVNASQPEGTVSIQEGAVFASDGRFEMCITPKENSKGSKSALYELIYQTGKIFESESSNSPMGRRQIVEDTSKVIPEQIVRITDSKNINDPRNLRANSLVNKETFSLSFNDSKGEEKIRELINNELNEWKDFGVKSTLDLKENGQYTVNITGPTGHISSGGPNLKYIAAKVIHDLRAANTSFILDGDAESYRVAGSIRIKAPDWQERINGIETNFNNIISLLEDKFPVKVEIIEPPKITIPPVVNDNKLFSSALRVLEAAQIETTNKGMPTAPAETFALWLNELKIPGLYYKIGFGDKEEIERLKNTGESTPERFMQHTPAVINTFQKSSVIPYGAIHSLIALELAKNLKINL